MFTLSLFSTFFFNLFLYLHFDILHFVAHLLIEETQTRITSFLENPFNYSSISYTADSLNLFTLISLLFANNCNACYKRY